MKQLNFFSDPAHGWLAVPAQEVEDLGIKVSSYSYRHKDIAYLEEDCDASKFINAFRLANPNEEIQFRYISQDPTPIRNYNRYYIGE